MVDEANLFSRGSDGREDRAALFQHSEDTQKKGCFPRECRVAPWLHQHWAQCYDSVAAHRGSICFYVQRRTKPIFAHVQRDTAIMAQQWRIMLLSKHLNRYSCSEKTVTNPALPWVTEASCWPGLCRGAVFVLSCSGMMFSRVFLGPVCSMELSSLSSVWTTGLWGLGSSTGWFTDFRLLSTKKNRRKTN